MSEGNTRQVRQVAIGLAIGLAVAGGVAALLFVPKHVFTGGPAPSDGAAAGQRPADAAPQSKAARDGAVRSPLPPPAPADIRARLGAGRSRLLTHLRPCRDRLGAEEFVHLKFKLKTRGGKTRIEEPAFMGKRYPRFEACAGPLLERAEWPDSQSDAEHSVLERFGAVHLTE